MSPNKPVEKTKVRRSNGFAVVSIDETEQDYFHVHPCVTIDKDDYVSGSAVYDDYDGRAMHDAKRYIRSSFPERKHRRGKMRVAIIPVTITYQVPAKKPKKKK